MRVSELMDILRDQPPDAEVELAIVAPVTDEEEDITVDRYTIDGMLPWHDEDEEGHDQRDDDPPEPALASGQAGAAAAHRCNQRLERRSIQA